MKRKFYLSWLLMFLSVAIFGQDYYADLKQKMVELSDNNQHAACYEASLKVLKAFPDDIQANVLACFSLINQGKTSQANSYAEAALEIDPTLTAMHYNMAYILAASDKMDEAKNYLLKAIKLGPDEMVLSEIRDEFKKIGAVVGKPQNFENLNRWYQQTYPTVKDRELSLSKAWEALISQEGDVVAIKHETMKMVAHFNSIARHDLALVVHQYGSVTLNNNGFPSEAIEMINEAYLYYQRNGFSNNHYVAGAMFNQLLNLYVNKVDGAKALTFFDESFSHVGKAKVKTIDVINLTKVAQAYLINSDGQYNENHNASRIASLKAYELAVQNSYGLGMALAANAVLLAHSDASTPGSNAIGAQFGEKGLMVAEELKLDTKQSIMGNLAICYYGMGTTESHRKAKSLLRYLIDEQKRDQLWNSAADNLNNLGAMYIAGEQWEEAALAFEEVTLLDGYSANYNNPKDRLTFYQQQVGAYQYLVMCYARLGNAEKTFRAMEGSRARVLSERLNVKSHNKSIADLQELLKSDEACIMYSLVSGYEVIMLTVTKKYANVTYHEDARFIGDLREKYWKRGSSEQVADPRDESALNQFEMMSMRGQNKVARDIYDRTAVAPKSDFEKATKQTRNFFEQPGLPPEILADYLYRFQKFLIVPVSNRLSGIKSLIIAPDDILNFIPFEALRLYDGKYLVEKYNIRYMHSTSIMVELQQRKYSESRKPLLAMGGAVYEEMNQEPAKIKKEADMNLLELEVAENIRTGKSQRKAYATLFGKGPMPYLQGTLEEVKSISKNLPGSDVYLGTDMNEKRLKGLSESGELSNYKVLHLATHGFVVSEIPDLSGVAMSIFKDEQDGEDGFLNASEIANLNLNADLTVLSACQTALGKLYAGEGVAGLTQSILVGGSNAALVSLWPVSDASTMIFMSNFYKEVSKGKPYYQIVNDLKKKFIKGDFGKEFTHPNYWAPFIYYGQ